MTTHSKGFGRLILERFQIHKRIVVELGEGVTTFIGKSDAGKTAILRGLQWLCLSDWDSCYLQFGQEEAFGSLTVGNRTIKRRKGKKVNLLKLDNKVFAAFAGNVPDEVQQLLQVTELNFQNQLDAHFWFSDTAGQVSKQLNQIVNLQDIDKITAAVASDLRAAKAEVGFTETRLREAEDEVKSLEWTIDLERKVKRLWKLNAAVVALRLRQARLAVLFENLARHRRRLNNAKEQAVGLTACLQAGERLMTLKQRHRRLSGLLSSLKAHKAALKKVPSFDRIAKAYKEVRDCSLKFNRIDSLLENLKMQKDYQCEVKQELQEVSRLLKETSPKICPSCGQTIKS